MFGELVDKLSKGTNLRPVLRSLAAKWTALPEASRNGQGTLAQFAYAAWVGSEIEFPWQAHVDVLGEVTHPFTAQIVFKSRFDPTVRTWEIIGFNPVTRERLVNSLKTIRSIPEVERTLDLKVMEAEILTALRIEEMALRRQIEHLKEFLLDDAKCRILQVHGIDDAAAQLRGQSFRGDSSEDCGTRLRSIVGKFFTFIPSILDHPTSDAVVALRETGADRMISYDPRRKHVFELDPVIKAECDLYFSIGEIEPEVGHLSLTISAVTDVLEQRFQERSAPAERISA